MIDTPGSTDPLLAPDKASAAFKGWLRRLVTDTAELVAFDAGEIDAVMDRDSVSALLLPEAQTALHDSSLIVLSAFDALPAEVCVLDARHGASQAWRMRAPASTCGRAKTSSPPASTHPQANAHTRMRWPSGCARY